MDYRPDMPSHADDLTRLAILLHAGTTTLVDILSVDQIPHSCTLTTIFALYCLQGQLLSPSTLTPDIMLLGVPLRRVIDVLS